MIITERDHGRSFDVKVRDVITVRLKENPTTGYRWSVQIAHGLEQTSDNFEASDAIGSEGVRVFKFRTISVGSSDLRLKKLREWEGEGSVIDRFNVKIIVK